PDVAYKDAADKNFSQYVKASNEFNENAEIVLESELPYDRNGALITGETELTFSATDKRGNIKRQIVSLNIKNATDNFAFDTVNIDYGMPYYTVNIGNRRVQSVYCEGNALDETFYLSNNGYFMLTPELAKEFGKVSDKEIYVNFNTCSAKITLNITDNANTSYAVIGDVDGQAFSLYDEIYTPYLKLTNSSIQNATFNYYIERGGVKTELNDLIFIPSLSGNYKFIAEIVRNGSVKEDETVIQSFTVSHYSANLLDLSDYIVLGKQYDMSVKTDLTDVNVEYEITDENGILSVNNNKLTAVKEGSATVKVNVNNGEKVKEIKLTSVDFYKGQGATRDFSQDVSFWVNDENNSVSYKNKVADLRTTAQKYEYNALQAIGAAILKAGMIDAAKAAGYKYLSFYCFADNADSSVSVYYENHGEEILLADFDNGGRWLYGSIQLSDVKDGSYLKFVSDGNVINLAKVEFIGTDISDYAKNYIKESTTSGRSVDLVQEDLWGKVVQTICNTNNTVAYEDTGSDRVSTTDNGDYFTFTRSGYLSTYGRIENSLYINSEWIMAARSLGYDVIGIWVNNCDGYSFLKREADGTILTYKNNGNEWHAVSNNKWGFISLDLSTFNECDTVIISISGDGIQLSGITFRTRDYAVPNLQVG
ncbi:MAG: hypothetical protein J6Y43_03540, partial [Clostridia bacterium]|nr:hypothetical protein [Clostridia bacterium]